MLDKHHPLGRGQAFTFALGVFWEGRCEGVLTFGNPISNLAVHRYGLRQCDSLELRKMWCSDVLPTNSESRTLAIAAKLIRKHYPQIKLLLTYCAGDELAAAYKACGWIPQEAHTYVREVLYQGRWHSIRNANKLRITKLATDKRTETRRKFVLPLDASVVSKVERPAPSGEVAARNRPGRSKSPQKVSD